MAPCGNVLEGPLTGEQKDAILADARAQRIASTKTAQAVLSAKKSAALGMAAPKKIAGAAVVGAAPAAKAKAALAAKEQPSAKSAGKVVQPSKKAGGARAKASSSAATKEAAPAVAPPAAAAEPELALMGEAQREAQRAQRAAERERLRAEMNKLIHEDEKRTCAAEVAARKIAGVQRALEDKLLEAAFDGELASIERQLAEWQADTFSTLIGAKLAFADANGHSLLSEAGVAGHTQICRLLLEAGAEVNARNRQSRTPLWRAAFQGHTETVRLLLLHGADPRIASTDAETPSMIASVAALRDELNSWDVARIDVLLAAARNAVQWRPPPPNPRDASVPSGKSGHSAQIVLSRFPDVLEEVTLHGERYLLVVDLGGRVLSYLQYRDTNLLNFCRPADITPGAVRSALVGALRYGKPLVLDATILAEVTLEMLEVLFSFSPGLLASILDRRILTQDIYALLLTDDDLDARSDLRLTLWQEQTTKHFCLVILTKSPIVEKEMTESFFVLKCA
ncbi:hypothetical protein T492DRAFT_1102242 [Pavlovales sp. CCMP2436]|nr:hypothetical protein T492DRAFT_1102242 [Pavlovales sp. CCMP2436]